MHDTLGDRIKKYEKTTNFRLLPKSPLFIRIDGRAFHTFTKGCDKPFDQALIDSMVYAAQMTAKEMSGFKLAYVQSDEATFMLSDYDNFETQGWFDYELNKVVSISASAFTAYFNQKWRELCTLVYATDENMPRIKMGSRIAMFDSRAFTVPIDDAPNAFIWRQRDWERNSVQMLARAHFSHKECTGKKIPDLHEMLHRAEVNWAKIAPQLKNGTWVEHDGTLSYDKLDYSGVRDKLWPITVS